MPPPEVVGSALVSCIFRTGTMNGGDVTAVVTLDGGQNWLFPGVHKGNTGTFTEYVLQFFDEGESPETPITVTLTSVQVWVPRTGVHARHLRS